MMQIFEEVSNKCSRLTTKEYSTSFYLGVLLLDKTVQKHICNIYGFVRFADEIVDTFHDFNKKDLLEQFENDTYKAIEQKISLNPILNSFQQTVNKYGIETELIDLFLQSMKMDLAPQTYDQSNYDKYILGSAEAVGLMCLRVFTDGNKEEFQALKPFAMKLGSVFQKVNFLRDFNFDYNTLNRNYFPNTDFNNFSEKDKQIIFQDIQSEFNEALIGIKKLPPSSRFGVYLAYKYYSELFLKIKKTETKHFLTNRIRIPNIEKYIIFLRALVRYKLSWY